MPKKETPLPKNRVVLTRDVYYDDGSHKLRVKYDNHDRTYDGKQQVWVGDDDDRVEFTCLIELENVPFVIDALKEVLAVADDGSDD